MSDSVEHRVIRQIADRFKRDPATIDRASVAADFDGWDSLTHAEIILDIEDAFSVEFDAADIARFENLGSIIDAIQRRSRA